MGAQGSKVLAGAPVLGPCWSVGQRWTSRIQRERRKRRERQEGKGKKSTKKTCLESKETKILHPLPERKLEPFIH